MKRIIFCLLFLLLFFVIFWISNLSIGKYIDNVGILWSNDELENKLIFNLISESSQFVLVGVTALITVFFFLKKDWGNLAFYYVVLIGGIVFNFLLKSLFHRHRPFGKEKFYQFGNFKIESYSFPSGHSMRIAILMLVLVYFTNLFVKNKYLKNVIIFLFISYLIIEGLSRIILEDHFVTDVIASIFASISWLLLCIYFKENLKARCGRIN